MKKLNFLLLALCISGATTFGQYWSRTGTNTYLQNSSDKVGIGISAPLEKLHINGSIRGNETGGSLRLKTDFGYLIMGPQNNTWCHFRTDKNQYFFDKPVFISSGILASYDLDDLKLATSQDNSGSYNVRMTIKKATGNVGIGTNDPAEKLHVMGSIRGGEDNGTLKIQTARGYLTLGPRSSGWCQMETDRDNFYFNKPIWIYYGKLVSYNPFDLNFCTGLEGNNTSTVRMTIKNSNGYVGIGIINPQTMLMVNGTITAKEVVISMDAFADYVFADNYQLMPLNELESHIKANKHLPGIPSEAEVTESGAALGSISTSMLAKIEELTLYLIEQNKQIESLKKEVEGLKSANK